MGSEIGHLLLSVIYISLLTIVHGKMTFAPVLWMYSQTGRHSRLDYFYITVQCLILLRDFEDIGLDAFSIHWQLQSRATVWFGVVEPGSLPLGPGF